MSRILHSLPVAAVILMLQACGSAAPPPPGPAVSLAPQERLARLVANYWEDSRRRMPADVEDISPQFLADSLALERRYLAAVLAIPPPPADPESMLTYEMFRRGRESAIEGFVYPSELLPINPFDSMPQRFLRAVAGVDARTVSGDADLQRWLGSVDAYARWTGQAITNLRDGARRGYTVPRVLIEDLLPPLAALGADSADNPFYGALGAVPGNLPEAVRNRLRTRMAAAVKDKILPAYRTLYDFLKTEYLPRARTSVGLAALPMGDAWYAYRVRLETGGQHSPAEIQVQGEAEVERVHQRMKSLLAEAGYADNARGYIDSLRRDPHASFGTAEELMSFYGALREQTAAAMPALFSNPAPADVVLRAVQGFEAASAPPVFYRGADPREKGPGVLYVNVAADAAAPRMADAPQFLQEGLPGRLYRISIQRTRPDLPAFRRYGDDPAFAAGWDLYAATLGDDLGVYRDAAPRFLMLLRQLQCAAGVVVDTGLHAQGWSRQRAIDYVASKLPVDEAAARALVDRDISSPADALSCTLGERKIRALRAAAEQALGARFETRAFHAAILDGGAMPLDLLETRVKRWVEGQR